MAKTIVNTPKAPAKKAPAKKTSPETSAKPKETLPKLKAVEVKNIGNDLFAVFIAGKQKVYTSGTKEAATRKAKAIKKNMDEQVKLFMAKKHSKATAIELTNTLEF